MKYLAILALCATATADEYLYLGAGNYMINGRVVISLPFGNGKYWEGGYASRLGNNWYGTGWQTYPTGEPALTATMVPQYEPVQAYPVQETQVPTTREDVFEFPTW